MVMLLARSSGSSIVECIECDVKDWTGRLFALQGGHNRFELEADTFVVRNGKIVTQTFAGKISPKSGSQ